MHYASVNTAAAAASFRLSELHRVGAKFAEVYAEISRRGAKWGYANTGVEPFLLHTRISMFLDIDPHTVSQTTFFAYRSFHALVNTVI